MCVGDTAGAPGARAQRLPHAHCWIRFPRAVVAMAISLCAQIGVLRGAAGGAGAPVSVTGVEFDELAAVEQQGTVDALALFARVEPAHKTRLVELLKAGVRAAASLSTQPRSVWKSSQEVDEARQAIKYAR